MVAYRAVGVVVGSLFLAAACSTFGAGETTTTAPDAALTNDDAESPVEASTESDVGPDVAPPDAGAVDAGIDSAVGPSNLLANGDFDKDCTGWSSLSSQITWLPDGHSVPGSCQVCIDGPAAGAFMQTVSATIPANGALTGTIWFKAASTSPAVSSLTLAVSATGPGQSESGLTVDDTWRPLTVEATNTAIQSMNATFTISFPGGTPTHCFVIDDATLFQE